MKKLTSVVCGCMFALSASAESISLEQAVAQTLQDHPQLHRAFARYKAATEVTERAQGAYLPTIDVHAGYGWQQVEEGSNGDVAKRDNNATELGISLRQQLFNGFATVKDVERSEQEALAERWNLINEAENIALRVVEVYLEVFKQKQLLELAEKNVTVHQQIYNDISKRTASGLGSSADLSQIQGRLARANSNMLSAKNNYFDAQTQYLRVVNGLPEDLVEPAADLNYLPESLGLAQDKALQAHPLLRAAQLDINAALAQSDIAKGRNYPTLALELDASWNDDTQGYENYQDDQASAMLRLRYNLFNGGSDMAEIRRSAYEVNQAKAVNQDAHRQVIEGTRLAWTAWQTLLEQKAFLQGHVEASSATVEAYKKQFNLGKRSLLDVLNTENELFDSRSLYLQASFDELRAQYRILNATGELLAALRVEQPTQWSE